MKLIIDQTRTINHPAPEQIAASLAAFDESVILELDEAGELLQAAEQLPGRLLVEHVAPGARLTLGVVSRDTAVSLFQAAARGDRAWRADPLWRPEERAKRQPAPAYQRPFDLAEARKLFVLVAAIGLAAAIVGYGLPALTNPRQRAAMLGDLPGMAVSVLGGVLGFAALIVCYQAIFSLLRPAIARWLSGLLGVTVVQRSQSPRHRGTITNGMTWVVREDGTGKGCLVGLLDISITLALVMAPFAALAGLLFYLGSR